MKYMIMLYGSQQDYDALAGKPDDGAGDGASGRPAMTEAEVAAMHAHMEKIHQELADSGELVFAQGLSAPVHARRIRLREGVPVVTDGPYPETQEVLAGFTIVECDSFDRATQIAAGFVNPATSGGVEGEGEYVDVRPIIDGIEDLSA